MREFKDKLEVLTDTNGIPGFENDVREVIASMVMDSCKSLRADSFGNLIAKCGADDGFKIGVFAHMDEVGMIVTGISSNGLLSFDFLGMIDERILPGSNVIVVTSSGEKVPGVIGNKSKHLQTAGEANSVLSYKNLTIDIGASNRKTALEMGVAIGCPVSFGTKCSFYENNMVMAKALDDRVGCLALVTLINEVGKNLENVTLYGFFTAQEEIGARGARAVANGYGLDMYICLDTVPVKNGNDLRDGDLNLGDGPVIRISDAMPGIMYGAISNPKLVSRAVEVASLKKIPYVCDVLHSTFLDSSTCQFTDNGIPGVSICFPRRYSHTQVEMCYLPDIDNGMTLLNGLVSSIDDKPVTFGKIYK